METDVKSQDGGGESRRFTQIKLRPPKASQDTDKTSKSALTPTSRGLQKNTLFRCSKVKKEKKKKEEG